MKLLIVDDSRTMRSMLTAYAKNSIPCDVVEAADGCDAIKRLEDSGPFTAALVDWDMPRMDGFTLLKIIRERSEYDVMKVMMVTAQSSIERVSEALDAGADDYLMKPLDEEMLVNKLRILGLEN